MFTHISIRQTNSTYEIYTIDEKEEEECEFAPYHCHKVTPVMEITRAPKDQRVKTHLSQSVDCNKGKRAKLGNLKRCKTSDKEGEKHPIRGTLQIKPNHLLLPQVIHTNKHSSPQRQVKDQNISKKQQLKLQTAIKQFRPNFFNDLPQKEPERPNRMISLGVINNSNIFLSQVCPRSTVEPRELPISKKQLKKLVMVKRILSAHETQQLPALSKSALPKIPSKQ